jgi:hypothetical protein
VKELKLDKKSKTYIIVFYKKVIVKELHHYMFNIL